MRRFVTSSLLASLLASLALLGAACTVAVEGNGVPGQEQRLIASFHDLEVSDTLHAQVIAGQTQSVIVHGDSNLLHHIRTDVSGGYLFVDADTSYSTNMDLGVLITTPTLYGVTARDAAWLEVDGLYDTGLSVVADDAATVRLSGWVDDVDLYVDGAATLDAAALGTWTAWIEMNGASNASLNVGERLSGTIAGSATAVVYGRPAIIDAVVLDAAQIVVE